MRCVFAVSVLLFVVSPRASAADAFPETLTLANGMRVRYKYFPGHPVAYINIVVRAGASDESPDKLGLSYVLARVLERRRASGGTRTQAIPPWYAGGKTMVRCETPSTYILITAPTKYVAGTAEWVGEAIFAPVEGIEQGELDTVKEQILARELPCSASMIRLMNMFGFGLGMHRALSQRLFAGTPYARPVFGTAQAIGQITLDDLRAWHESCYTGENVLVSVTGGFDAAELTRIVKAQWSTLPRGHRVELPAPCEAFAGPVRLVLRDMDLRTTRTIWCGFAWPDGPHGHEATHVVLRQAIKRRLYEQRLRQPHLAYTTDVDRTRLGGVSYSFSRAKVRNRYASDILKFMNSTLLRLAQQGITPREFEEAKRVVACAPERWIQDPQVMGRAYVMTWSEAILSRMLNDCASSVTIEDVNRVARACITPRNRFVVVRKSVLTPRQAIAVVVGAGLGGVAVVVLLIRRLRARRGRGKSASAPSAGAVEG